VRKVAMGHMRCGLANTQEEVNILDKQQERCNVKN
jgi:hypothetical protein